MSRVKGGGSKQTQETVYSKRESGFVGGSSVAGPARSSLEPNNMQYSSTWMLDLV